MKVLLRHRFSGDGSFETYSLNPEKGHVYEFNY